MLRRNNNGTEHPPTRQLCNQIATLSTEAIPGWTLLFGKGKACKLAIKLYNNSVDDDGDEENVALSECLERPFDDT